MFPYMHLHVLHRSRQVELWRWVTPLWSGQLASIRCSQKGPAPPWHRHVSSVLPLTCPSLVTGADGALVRVAAVAVGAAGLDVDDARVPLVVHVDALADAPFNPPLQLLPGHQEG